MQDLIKAAMAAIEAEKSEQPNALQSHLTAVTTHLAAAVEALREKPKTDTNPVSDREVIQLLKNMW